MLLSEIDIDPDDADTNLIAEAQTPLDAGNLTLATTTLDYARQIGITSDDNDSGRTFTITGTDADGYSQTEEVTGPNATIAESAKYFKTITTIAVDAATAGEIIVGTVDELVTRTIPLDRVSPHAAAINVDVTGTIDVTVQQTFDNVQRLGSDYVGDSAAQNAQWLDISALAAKTADTTSTATVGATAIRLKVNSYTNGAEIQMNVNQPGRT